MSRHHCHGARRGTRPSTCALSNIERHPNCKKHTHTHSTRDRYATGDCHHYYSISSHCATNQLCSLEEQRHAATSASPMTVTRPPIYKSGSCRMSRRHCHSTRRECDQANCALSNHERHHGCQNASISYIPYKISMYENVMLSDVASSLSQRPSRIATKQLRAFKQRATPRLPETLPYKHIFPSACDRYVATNLSSLSQHSSRDTSKYYALSNDKRSAAALTSPVTFIHPPIYMSGRLSNDASSLSQRLSRIATEQLRALEQRAAPDFQNAPSVDIYSSVPPSSQIATHCQLS